jgi:hypothetical protein
MTQVLKSQNFLEGFSCIQTFGDDLVLCGVGEKAIVIDAELNPKFNLNVDLGVIDCKTREDCKVLFAFLCGFI